MRTVHVIQDREGEVWPEEDKTLPFVGFHFPRKLKASVISTCSEETVQQVAFCALPAHPENYTLTSCFLLGMMIYS